MGPATERYSMTELDDERWTYIESGFEQFNFNGDILAPKSVQKGAGSSPCGLLRISKLKPDSLELQNPIRDLKAP